LRTFVYFPDANIGWLPYAVAAGKSLMMSWKPDLILASSPPPTSLLVAHRLSKKFGVPWVADLRDLWVDHQYYKQPGWRKAVETKLEKRVLSSAAGLVTVSEPLAESLRAKYRQPTIVVLNGFDPGDYPTASGSAPPHAELRILYTGATYPGKQDVSPLFAALRQLGPLAEKVRIVFHGSYLSSIQEAAAQYEVEHLVEVKAAIPYKESLRMQSESDILLLLLWTDTRQRGVYTGKLFEYIGARRPILAIGGVDCVAAELIASRHAGVALKEPGAIAARLQQWIRQKDEAGGIPRLPEESLIGISREEQVGVLEGFLAGRLQSQLNN
jgi:glycosyltransferase involved in cell wall biosynthesis